ncbi:MAG: class I SAM-dependent methyltransferase [Chloroflexi bacterium]|nr:class I SAM-dependent methyltransferase [Chloroflexota bacterium]
MKNNVNLSRTARARAKWDRNARFYDIMTRMMEGRKAREWYRKLWENVRGPKALEVGVGTGRSFEYRPKGMDIIGIDLSPRMLSLAKREAKQLGMSVDLREMDVQRLEFADNTFDSVVAACTFCSVPDPVLGLKEVARVLKPEGKVFLLEHMRHGNRIIGKLMDWANPMARLIGPEINRRTLDNIRKAGLQIESAQDMALGGILKFIVASRRTRGEG